MTHHQPDMHTMTSAGVHGDIQIGVSLFDTEHREIEALVKRLRDEDCTSSNAAYLRGRFDALVKKLRKHFEHEEEYMLHSGYPARKHHCEDHARLTGALDRLIAQMDAPDSGAFTFGPPLVQFFDALLPLHVSEEDCPLGYYLNSKGIR
jgi:hemerythrin-like metal-binding protein